MSEVVAFKRPPRRNSRRAIRLALVAQIIEALEKLGGTAHCEAVIEQIVRDRKLTDPVEVRGLRSHVMEVFEAHCEPPARLTCEQPVFRRVFGADSRRWTFSRDFHEQLRRGVTNLEQQVV